MKNHPYPQSKNLEDLLTWANISKAKLGEKIGVSVQSISAWARRTSVPRADHVFHMAVVLGVPLVLVYKALGYEVERLPEVADEAEVDPELQGILDQIEAYAAKKMSKAAS